MSRPVGYAATIRENGYADQNKPAESGWPNGTKKWSVSIKNPAGKTMSFQYFTGPAHTERPTFDDVMEAAISDGRAYEDYPTLNEFAEAFGYDLNEEDEWGDQIPNKPNKKTVAVFEACKSAAERIKKLLGDDYDYFAYPDQREDED